jgi:hypothetical protein
MKKKIMIGLLFGAVAGIIDVAPMIAMGLKWDANLSAFTAWVVSGFFIATSGLSIHPVLKGMLTTVLVVLPAALLVARVDPVSPAPMAIMSVVLGGALGFAIARASDG